MWQVRGTPSGEEEQWVHIACVKLNPEVDFAVGGGIKAKLGMSLNALKNKGSSQLLRFLQ